LMSALGDAWSMTHPEAVRWSIPGWCPSRHYRHESMPDGGRKRSRSGSGR
jgi:hypothetical protein